MTQSSDRRNRLDNIQRNQMLSDARESVDMEPRGTWIAMARENGIEGDVADKVKEAMYRAMVKAIEEKFK